MTGQTPDDGVVVMGRVVGLFGVQGWVKVHAYTRQRDDVLDYSRWLLRAPGQDWRELEAAEGRMQGEAVVMRFEGYADRDRAATLMGAELGLRRDWLPPSPPGSYYWADLEGLAVSNRAGVELGRVSYLFETGANDVMVVVGDRERLIPYVPGVVLSVDLDAGRMLVDWDADF